MKVIRGQNGDIVTKNKNGQHGQDQDRTHFQKIYIPTEQSCKTPMQNPDA